MRFGPTNRLAQRRHRLVVADPAQGVGAKRERPVCVLPQLVGDVGDGVGADLDQHPRRLDHVVVLFPAAVGRSPEEVECLLDPGAKALLLEQLFRGRAERGRFLAVDAAGR